MPQVRVLFDMNQAGDPVPARAFFRALVAAIETRMLAGCSLYHGYAEQPGHYSIVIYSDDSATLGTLARTAMSARWGLPVAPGVVLDQAPLRAADRLALAAKVDAQGYLEDVKLDLLADIWREAQTGYHGYQSPVRPMENAAAASPQPAYQQQPQQVWQNPQPASPAQPAWAQPQAAGGYGGSAGVTIPLPPQGGYDQQDMRGRYGAAPGAPAPMRRHVQFPTTIPAALDASATRDRATAAIGGAVTGVLVSFAIFLLAPKSTMLFQMFDLTQPATVIPVSVMVMFFWGIAICLLRWRRLGAMESLCGEELLKEAIPLLDDFGLHGLHAELGDPVVQVSPLLRRVKVVLHQWSLHPSLQDTDVVLQQMAASDDESIHTGYNMARTFVWALPVLGLIGTVIGIAGAVGGFAKFLGGSIDDINIIKQNLVNVTGGLSFAFLITLEGLLTSLILMLAASWLQTRERELYARVQEDVADELVPALQRVAPEAYKTTGKQSMDLTGIREALSEHVSACTAQMAAVGDRFVGAMDSKHSEWLGKLETTGATMLTATKTADSKMWQDAQGRMTTAINQIASGMEGAASQVQSGMSQKNEEFLLKLSKVFEDFSSQQSTLAIAAATRHQEFETRAAANVAQQQALLQKLNEQAETTRTAAAALASLSETTQRVLQFQQDMSKALADLDGGPTRAAFDGFASALSAGSAEMGKVVQSAENLGRLSQQIIASQASLQQATQQLAESQFATTMSEFRQALSRLAPVLASFQKPFVLQAVPFGKDGVD